MTTALPAPEKMASMVTNVTQTMLGFSFQPDPGRVNWGELVWRTAVLHIAGGRPVSVGISSDQNGCLQLSAAMFAVDASAVDSNMMNDALCELVNMTAGMVKGALSLKEALGLPRIVSGPDAPKPGGSDHRSVVLKAPQVGLVLWIFEGLV
jgi:CheY-specific phosphatase CheX